MTRPRLPFAWYDGKPCLVVNFTLDNEQNPYPTPKMLKDLLRHHDANNILLLRRLSEDEVEALTDALDDAAVDVWAHLVGSEGND